MKAALLGLALASLWAQPARAELVYFSSGRTLSVAGHAVQGNMVVLSLRRGGELVCEASLIERIAPDEVPYSDPEVALEERPVETGAVEPRQGAPINGRFDPLIQRLALEQGVDPELVRAIVQVESAYQPRARSPKGAVGLMQLMPATARRYGVRNPYDPEANLEAGIKHLKSLLNQFPLRHALAAYNAGESAVARFQGVPPFRETENYVAKVLRLIGG